MTDEHEPKEKGIEILPFKPFYYNPESGQFIIGFPGSLKLIELQQLQDIWDFDRETGELVTTQDPFTPETLVSISYGPLVQMSYGRKILQEIISSSKQKQELSATIRKIIKDVYHLLEPTVVLPEDRSGLSHFDFGVTLFDEGTFTLRTFGDCACFGPVSPAMYVSLPAGEYRSENVSFPVELGLHNTFSRAQRLSLYAGAGAIGWLTKNR